MSPFDVCVVGSANLDIVATTRRHPRPGETVHGIDYHEYPGGKGLNQAVAALRNLYRDHLGRDWDIWKKIKILRVEPLPHVLTSEEVAQLLSTFRKGRFRAFFTVIYHCGLRLSEARHIKPKHIDSNRLIIRIVNGKGGKSREPCRRLRAVQSGWSAHRPASRSGR